MVSVIATGASSGGRFGQLAVLLAGIAGVALIAAIGTLLGRPSASASRPAYRAGGRSAIAVKSLTVMRNRIADRTHPLVAALVVLGAGIVLAVGITYAFGLLTKAGLIVHLDRPVDRFVDRNRIAAVSRLMLTGTLLGSYTVCYTVAIAGGVIVSVLSRRWLPLLALVVAVMTEIFLQQRVGTLVHGTKPAQTTAIGAPGGFFSGGSARTLFVYGLLTYFVAGWIGLQRRQRVLLWTLVALATFVEGYSRLYLGRHWAVDIAGGWLLGGLALASFMLAAGALRPAARADAALGRSVSTSAMPEVSVRKHAFGPGAGSEIAL
jgi:membrane-associated phospholipid phosphatase